MKRILEIEGQKAEVSFNADTGLLRGEFIELSGGADFYAETMDALKIEAEKSLRVYLDLCAEKQIAPYKTVGR